MTAMVKAEWRHHENSPRTDKATLTKAHWQALRTRIIAHGGRVISEVDTTSSAAYAAVLIKQGASS